MSYFKKIAYNKNLKIINQAAKDLIRKDLVPSYTKSYILDNIPKMAYNRIIDHVKWLRCPKCNIELPSRMIMHQHLKYCNNVAEKLKENETIVTDTKVDFNG